MFPNFNIKKKNNNNFEKIFRLQLVWLRNWSPVAVNTAQIARYTRNDTWTRAWPFFVVIIKWIVCFTTSLPVFLFVVFEPAIFIVSKSNSNLVITVSVKFFNDVAWTINTGARPHVTAVNRWARPFRLYKHIDRLLVPVFLFGSGALVLVEWELVHVIIFLHKKKKISKKRT